MLRGIAKTERDAFLQLDSSQKVNLSNVWLTFIPTVFLGMCFATAILLVGGLSNKWVFALVLAGSFPLFVVVIGSLEKAFQAILIFSLSTTMDVNPWLSESFAALRPGVPITLTSIILLALYTLWLVRLYLRSASIHIFPSVTIPFAIMVFWSGLSFLVAADSAYVVSMFPRALTAFMLFIYTANWLKSHRDIRFVVKCVAITVAFSGILGIFQYIGGTSFDLEFLGGVKAQIVMDYPGETFSRVSGLFSQPNNFAHLMDALLPMLLVCAVAIDGFCLRVLCSVSFALGLIGLVLTFSRGGGLALLISFLVIIVFVLKRQNRKNFRGSLVRLLVLVSIALVLIAPYFSKIITRAIKDDYGAAFSRITMAQTALKVVKDKPITGVGLGNYGVVVLDYDPDAKRITTGTPILVHNMYLLIAAELGLPVFGIFLWMSILLFRQAIIAIASADNLKSLLALGILGGIAGFYFYGMFEDVSFGGPRFILLSAIAGFLMALRYPMKQNIL